MLTYEPTTGKRNTTTTPREHEVIRLVAQGLTNKQIAHHLSITRKTVEVHRHNAMRALDPHSTAHLVRFAIRHRIIDP